MIKEQQILINKLSDLNLDKKCSWALYGTGEGAELIYEALQKMHMECCIKYVIENDDSLRLGRSFHDIIIQTIAEVSDNVDIIIVGARINHRLIAERISDYLKDENINDIRVVDVYGHNTEKEKAEYAEYMEKSVLKVSEDFVSFDESGYLRAEDDTKIIAWYLPQFHQIEINNKFHGQGFTEWTNTTRAIPLFTGHYQPHIPYDVGYYDVMNVDTFKRQIYLAKHYGIYGFCFHYYWFSGEKIMEKPIELFLEHKELDMPFCFNWATENWTTVWDGGNNHVMYEQKLEEQDDERFMQDVMPYMKDARYIKIDGKPVLSIYKCGMFEKERFVKLMNNFRDFAKREGFPDLFIMITNASNFDEDVREWGADAIVEFPPWTLSKNLCNIKPNGYLNPYYNGKIYDAVPYIEARKYMMPHTSQCYFRSALTSFDNTSRRCTVNGNIFLGLTPTTFKQWLKDIMIESKEIHNKSQDIVFANSWNEWAEGSHIEPDMKYGYAYLQAIKEAIEEVRK